MKRVVVTGIGAITPLGNSFIKSWEAINTGESGVGQITKFDASCLPWKLAGEIRSFDAHVYLSQKEINRLDPFVQCAVAAAVMAAEDAGLIEQSAPPMSDNSQQSNPPLPPFDKGGQRGVNPSSLVPHPSLLDSAGVIIGSSRGGISTIEKALTNSRQSAVGLNAQDSRLKTQNLRLSPYLMPSTTISMAASYVAQKLGIKGHCLGISNACASGTNAIGEAFRLLKSGYLNLVLAGGTESPICRTCVEGYGIAGALSKGKIDFEDVPKVPRPFDRDRDGFVLSEGACVLLLEDYEHAMKRDANIYAEIVGYGNTTDAFHITRPDPAGEASAMVMALNEAGVNPDEVDYINTHGTATKIGDIAEAEAIKMVFGKRASKIPATATKSATGHMLAASGIFEVASTLMSIKERIIPPTINFTEKDPACDINIITEKANADIMVAISNSFGFGGVNAVIALKAF